MSENKERPIIDPSEQIGRPVEMVDLQRKREEVMVPREVKHWMEKLEQDQSINNQSSNTNKSGDNDEILQPIATGVTNIVLPTDKKTFSEGFGKAMDSAGKWLSEFLFRLIKINISKGNKVKFNEE